MADLENSDVESENFEGSESAARFIDVGFKINSVSDIDSTKGTFATDIILFLYWDDESLIGTKVAPKASQLNSSPDIIVTNAFDLHEYYNQLKIVDSTTGRVQQILAFKGTCFVLNMDLTYFPFDAHNLPFCLRTRKFTIDEVEFRHMNDQSAMDTHPEHEWRIFGFCAKYYKTDARASSSGKVYSSLHVITLVQRQPGWFINNVIIVSFFLAVVNYSSFAFSNEAIREKMDISILTMLASISNKFVVGDKLAKVPYRTLTDEYIDVCFAVQVFTILSNVLVLHFEEAEGIGEYGKYLNLTLFLIALVGFIIYHIHFFYKIRWHDQQVVQWAAEAKGFKQLNIFPETSSKAHHGNGRPFRIPGARGHDNGHEGHDLHDHSAVDTHDDKHTEVLYREVSGKSKVSDVVRDVSGKSKVSDARADVSGKSKVSDTASDAIAAPRASSFTISPRSRENSFNIILPSAFRSRNPSETNILGGGAVSERYTGGGKTRQPGFTTFQVANHESYDPKPQKRSQKIG